MAYVLCSNHPLPHTVRLYAMWTFPYKKSRCASNVQKPPVRKAHEAYTFRQSLRCREGPQDGHLR